MDRLIKKNEGRTTAEAVVKVRKSGERKLALSPRIS
jgi:hypothetical protein